eukprot:Pgem_evm1s16884
MSSQKKRIINFSNFERKTKKLHAHNLIHGINVDKTVSDSIVTKEILLNNKDVF